MMTSTGVVTYIWKSDLHCHVCMMISTGHYNVCRMTITVLYWHMCMMVSTALSCMYVGRY